MNHLLTLGSLASLGRPCTHSSLGRGHSNAAHEQVQHGPVASRRTATQSPHSAEKHSETATNSEQPMTGGGQQKGPLTWHFARPEGLVLASRRTSRPIRRVLSPKGLAARRETAIHLGLSLPAASCGLPADSGGQPSNVRAETPGCLLLTLLRVGFTEPSESPRRLVVSYTTVSPLPAPRGTGGLLSVALSRGSPRVGVTHHPALWSPDVPREDPMNPHAAVRPARPPCRPCYLPGG